MNRNAKSYKPAVAPAFRESLDANVIRAFWRVFTEDSPDPVQNAIWRKTDHFYIPYKAYLLAAHDAPAHAQDMYMQKAVAYWVILDDAIAWERRALEGKHVTLQDEFIIIEEAPAVEVIDFMVESPDL